MIGVIGDTHLPRGSRSLPEDCVRRLRDAELILHTGDHSSVESLAALRALGPPVQAVHGNADEPDLRDSLPAELVAEFGGARIGMTHEPGAREGRDERLRARFPGCDAILYGHTHIPQVERVAGVWMLNPGSPTERRSSPTWTMLELRIEGGEIEPVLIDLSK